MSKRKDDRARAVDLEILKLLMRYRYGDTCPICRKTTHWHKMMGYQKFVCGQCNKQISPIATTTMRKSQLPLHWWLVALYITIDDPEYPATRFKELFNTTYKTAWHMRNELQKFNAKNAGDSYVEAVKHIRKIMHSAADELEKGEREWRAKQ